MHFVTCFKHLQEYTFNTEVKILTLEWFGFIFIYLLLIRFK
jgi:hypothetical protein